MNERSFLLCVLVCFGALVSQAAQSDRIFPAGSNAAAVALQAEADLIKEARQAAARDDDLLIDSKLATASHAKLQLGQSVALARRAAAVCAWLRNDNEYARATKLARRTITQLASLREANNTDRVERLYWEAILEGQILDRKARAVQLLREAAQLAPGDKRLRREEQRWAASLAEFGK